MKKFLVPMLVCAMFATGCSLSDFARVEQWLAVAAPSILQVLSIVALAKGVPVNPATVAKVQADAAAVQSLVKSVQSASQANMPSACSAFNEAVKTFAADVPTLESIGQVSDPRKQAQIADLVLLVQGAIADIEVPVASCQSPATASAAFAAAATRVKSPSDYAKKFNAVMDRAADTKKMKVHVHSKAVRYATFGMAK